MKKRKAQVIHILNVKQVIHNDIDDLDVVAKLVFILKLSDDEPFKFSIKNTINNYYLFIKNNLKKEM